LICPKCGRRITRKQGNLTREAWWKAIAALYKKHLTTRHFIEE